MRTLKPAVNGSVASYTVSPALPAGLSLDATSGEISGTPTAAAPRAAYRITASNGTGSATLDLSIEVQAASVSMSATRVSRIVSSGTSVAVTLSVRPDNFSFAAPLNARANDPTGVIS